MCSCAHLDSVTRRQEASSKAVVELDKRAVYHINLKLVAPASTYHEQALPLIGNMEHLEVLAITLPPATVTLSLGSPQHSGMFVSQSRGAQQKSELCRDSGASALQRLVLCFDSPKTARTGGVQLRPLEPMRCR
jgi:hypothetical protein